MSPFHFKFFFIPVQYIILQLNVSSRPLDYEKDTKIFVWNCALRSSSGVVFDCCAHAHIGSCTRGCEGERESTVAPAVPTLACWGR
jgi:hypothetical protein